MAGSGVNLFFILSGFVLFLPFASGDRPLDSTRDWLSFYRRRSLRLLPLFYVAVTAEWLVTAWLGGGDVHELLSVLSLGFIVDARTFGPSFNPPLWSIGVEIAFSALFLPLVDLSRRRGLLRLLALVIVAALATRVVGIIRYPVVATAAFGTDMFLCRLDEFVLGMVVAQLYVQHRLPRRPGRWALAGMALIAIAWVGFDLQVRGIVPPLTRAILGDVLDAGFCAIVLAALVPGTRLAAALSWRSLQVVGMMCYSVYIWHWPLLSWMMPDRAALLPGDFAAALVSYLLLMAALAALSYRFIEFAQARAWRPLFLLPAAVRAAPSPSTSVIRQ
jgi:peptidoglycan/LPS O-acetylase OafA/YrhL